MKVEVVERRLQDFLLLYFLDGGDVATEEQRRDQVLCILKEQLQAPIILTIPSHDIDSCEEFMRVKNVVERCLEWMCISGISLVPELSDEGQELVIHLFDD
jgi:hypothetical protein